MQNQKKILVVDDAQVNLLSAKRFLQTDYEVFTAVSGEAALELLQDTIPDLIMLDIIMPGLDGFETFERIKNNPLTADIPVIFLTADSDKSCELRGFRMGAMDFITKPFIPEVMLSRVRRIIEFYDMRNDLLHQVAVKTSQAQKDVLTGLYNRAYLEEVVNAYLQNDTAKGVLFILDLDNFKLVNDNYGHIVGDSVLCLFAEKIKACNREGDLACRIGGDEFIMYLPGSMEPQMIETKGYDIIRCYEQTLEECHVGKDESGVSVGACISPMDGRDFMTLYNNADRALYFVKQNGKRGFHLYNDTDSHQERPISVSTEMDISQLISLVRENNRARGAFEIEYEGFRNIYQFLSRCIDRTHQDVQLVLMTLYSTFSVSPDPVVMNEALGRLGECITMSLRKGDVATQFSSSQYVALLMDTDVNCGTMVVERIIEKYYSENSELKIKYDIRSL